MLFKKDFLNVLGPMSSTTFATLKIELYRIVDYDSKWSTKFHNYCMDFFFNFEDVLFFYNSKYISEFMWHGEK